MSKTVTRLRWWHRCDIWVGHAGWIYYWDRPRYRGVWVGQHWNHPDEPIALTHKHDTAAYGPYTRLGEAKTFEGIR